MAKEGVRPKPSRIFSFLASNVGSRMGNKYSLAYVEYDCYCVSGEIGLSVGAGGRLPVRS